MSVTTKQKIYYRINKIIFRSSRALAATKLFPDAKSIMVFQEDSFDDVVSRHEQKDSAQHSHDGGAGREIIMEGNIQSEKRTEHTEHRSENHNGNILSVSMEQIKTVGIVLGLIALLHLLFFKKFFALTESFAHNENHSIGIFNVWNFLFYISIGLSIVFAVRSNGVIPVFAYLIIPAVCAIMLSRKSIFVFILALLISIAGAFFGLNVSYRFDFPAGSSVVAMLGALFFTVAVIRMVRDFIAQRSR